MSHITLVRHGQANTEARDEVSYDKLSPLGHQQAAWLGDYLRDSAHFHPRVYCGTLIRHRETARSMGFGDEVIQDARLNELEYFNLAKLMEEQHGLPLPTEREEFARHMPRVFGAWQEDALENPPETWADFESRVRSALAEIGAGDGPALVVTSGGLIGMVMRQLLDLDVSAMARVSMSIMNTSMHRLRLVGDQLSPVLFNAVPHLDHPDRQFAQTHM
ncbi:histidine phosphatase family protein [Albibacillus kandeliae]|jgi:broad specificity phosphatase PhoE|uniref:histidine phosphatase family protein n=1 Tax=Albibacillus kandeliae TaxID=2174228 RepID=UPI000D68E805|nr:histidine phosphatase family protein [Albibacillus kandeliae]